MNKAKEIIKEAVCILSLTTDIDSITIQDIVEKAGYSRTYFYEHFESKNDLIQKIIYEEACLYAKYSYFNSEDPNNTEKYREMSINLLKHIDQNHEIYLAILNNRLSKNSLNQFYEMASQALFEKVKVNFSSSLGIDAEIYYGVAVMRYMCFIQFWANHNFSYTPEYLSDQIIKIYQLNQQKSETQNYLFHYF